MKTFHFLRSTRMKAASLLGLAALGAWFVVARASDAARAPNPWTLVLDRPSPGKYEDFAFPDDRHGWLVSAAGDILNTADGGATWTVQASGLRGLRSVDFVDLKRGFAGTLTGKLYATTDGGVHWTDIARTLPKLAKGFCGITHVGEHVHVVGKYTGEGADYFYSPDGGKTWTFTDLKPMATGLVDVAFTSDNVGFIGGMGLPKVAGQPGAAIILKTTDRGLHWRPVFQHDGGRGFAWKIFPINDKLIYAGLQSQDGIYRVAKTTDGGEKWEILTVATGRPRGPAIQGIGFIDAKTGWVGGFFRGMYTTTDGGRTWSELPMSDGTINRFQRVGKTLITAGSRGVLRYEPGVGKDKKPL